MKRRQPATTRLQRTGSSIDRICVARSVTASSLICFACFSAQAQAEQEAAAKAPPPSPASPARSTSPASITLAPIVVVAAAPLAGIGLPLTKVAANVQTVRASQLDAQHRETLTAYFEKNLPSVEVNDQQGSPYQVSVNYRGFTASALLGTPEGLSVFMDGVRINEPFGDVVNWDMIAQARNGLCAEQIAKRYASFGSLGQNFFAGPNHTFDGLAPVKEAFVGPGAPRGAWMGMRYDWD